MTPEDGAAPLTAFFQKALEDFDGSDLSLADVSVERGAELIRADRDGRSLPS